MRVTAAIQQVNQIAREAGTRVERLPAPSRRAIQFLQSIDWEKLPVTAEGSTSAPVRGRVTWSGLSRFVDRMMDRLADPLPETEIEATRMSIERMSRQMEGTIERQKLTPGDLSASSRELRGWLAFFSRAENIAAYVAAQKLGRAAFDPAAAIQGRFQLPLRIYFRPMRGIYKIRGSPRGSVLSLPTPMIAFDAAAFGMLASLIFRKSTDARRKVIEQMTAEGFQALHAELASLSGIVENGKGAVYDLGESFDRVNAAYFGNAMPRPRLTWSRSFTGRKFGHYDWILDTVMVSRTLDSPAVPAHVVDFIMYHELLHKKHGLHWVNGRGYAHTAEFYREEREFERYRESEDVLERLARGQR
jgi:hypothetical protein